MTSAFFHHLTDTSGKILHDGNVDVLVAVLSAGLGYLFARYRAYIERREEQRLAAAAFRFELESNLKWLDEIVESRNYLRDEAWVRMKNEGYVSFMKAPIPRHIIAVYDQIHRLNEHIRVIRESSNMEDIAGAKTSAISYKEIVTASIRELITVIDSTYPRIGRNFK